MSDSISKASVCEILADIYPTDGERVIPVKEIDKAYEAIQQLPSAQPELPRWAQKVEKYHDKALKMPYIKKHRAWALYQAYKEYNRYGK